jgi:hypothetical protein
LSKGSSTSGLRGLIGPSIRCLARFIANER